MKASNRTLILIMGVLAFLPVVITVSTFAGRVSLDSKVEPEIVNGIVTVSGIIFAFQPSFFRKPRDTSLRLIFTVIFLIESLLLVLTGYSYVVDALTLQGLSEYTLLIAVGSLILNISMMVFFVIVDLAVHSHQNVEK